jgi:Secretion system C-terminal sorting domain
MKTTTIIRSLGLFIAFSAIGSSAFAQSVIISPMGGEEITAGSIRTVSWNPKLITGMLTLSLWDGERAKWSNVFTNVPSEEGKISWAVPSNLQGKKFRVKLSTKGTVSGSALSRTFFTIVPPAAKVETQVAGVSSPIVCTVHPNPASSIAHICVEDLPGGVSATVEIVNELGNVVTTLYNATPEAEFGLCLTLDCSNLPSGIYYAHIMNDNMGQAVKLSVAH